MITMKQHLILQKDLLENINWDYLIILDDCRADIFEEVNTIEGDYKRVWSIASETLSWIDNMQHIMRKCKIYSCSPGLTMKLKGKKGYLVIALDIFMWSNKLKCVHPSSILKVCKVNPPKPKSIFWFGPPHYPFIGKVRFTDSAGNNIPLDAQVIVEVKKDKSLREKWIRGYIENVIITLKYVRSLIDRLEGVIIITSDHGEFLGEDNRFLHPNIEHPILRTVPFLIIGNRNGRS